MVTVCEHCNAVVARTDRTFETVGKVADLVETQSPLALWLDGRYGDIAFRITGRAQLRHGAGGVWDEWYLAFDDGQWGWLAEAQGGFYLTFEQAIAGAVSAQSLQPGHPVTVGYPPRPMVVAELGEAEIITGRGEIPYRLTPGQRYRYVDLSGTGGGFGTIDFADGEPTLFLGTQVSLAELGLAGAEPAHELDPDGAGAGVSVEAVRCDNCGGSLELRAPDLTERVGCPYCGALHDCNHGVLRLLSVVDKPAVAPILPLGSKGRFEDEELTVIGFMRRSTRSGWELFDWDEYLLYHPRLGFRWITYSDGHFTYLRPVAVADVMTSERGDIYSAGDSAVYNDKRYPIFQAGEAKVVYVAGELYWKVEAGQTALTADYVLPPEVLSSERSRGQGQNEMSWSLGTYMTHGEIAARFPGQELSPARPSAPAPNQPYPYKIIHLAWAGLLVAALGMLMWAQGTSTNNPVFSQGFALEPQTAGNPAAEGGQVIFTEPFRLIDGKNIAVRAYSSAVDNGWMYIQADLFNHDTGMVVPFDLAIEYYHGYDGGESWVEGSRTATRYLSAVPAGTYSLRLAVERSSRSPVTDATLDLSLRQGVFRLQYWLFMLFCMSIIPIGVVIHHIVFEHRRRSQSDFAGDSE